MKPYLRDFIPRTLSELPEDTSYEAGYLVTKNAGWRSIRQVINPEKCVGCLQCYRYCPDGVIYKWNEDAGRGKVAVDYDFCKGCGICRRICKTGAISMVDEKQALAQEASQERSGQHG